MSATSTVRISLLMAKIIRHGSDPAAKCALICAFKRSGISTARLALHLEEGRLNSLSVASRDPHERSLGPAT